MAQKIKVLIAKPGLDGHDRGAKVVAKYLMDQGMEVIYTGIRKTPATIADIALQEDVDVVGLSSLSGGHLTLFRQVMEELRKRQLNDIMVFGGGVIPDEDIPELESFGIAGIFQPGSNLAEVSRFIEERVNRGER
jgi:methylmalonyl-CoA mutase C-terminal domain/subunit